MHSFNLILKRLQNGYWQDFFDSDPFNVDRLVEYVIKMWEGSIEYRVANEMLPERLGNKNHAGDYTDSVALWVTLSNLERYGLEGRYYARRITQMLANSDDHGKIIIPIVAKQGGRGDDFAVYIGTPEPHLLSDLYKKENPTVRHTAEGCLAYGMKISESLARQLFEEFKEHEYRR